MVLSEAVSYTHLKWKLLYHICMQLLLTVHAPQEFVVVFGLLQTVFYEVHGFYRDVYKRQRINKKGYICMTEIENSKVLV